MNSADEILRILDDCGGAFTFPALDNGYVYLAGTRLSLHRSPEAWALVIEVFGFSPRSGLPDTHVYTFASRLHGRDRPDAYVSRQAYENYLANNPHNESRFVFPLAEGDWQDPENLELVAANATTVGVRGRPWSIPSIPTFEHHGIALEAAPQIHTFELCRYLAAVARDEVLARPLERRASVGPEMGELLVLEDWNHPDLVGDARPSESATFRQLAQVLVTGDVGLYRPSDPPNTHWRNWPDGGSL